VTHARYAVAFRRNAAVAGATGVALGFLFLYPTSTNSARTSAAEEGQHGVEASDGNVPHDAHAHSAGGAAGLSAGAPMDVIMGGQAVDGPAVATPYGPVRVRIYLTEGRLAWVEIPEYPRETAVDKVLNDDAIPKLRGWTLLEESAAIDTVSGATATSAAYKESLQAALDAANL
jgi:hypothetical protein